MSIFDALAEPFRAARPFNHVVIDNFFEPGIAEGLAKEFPDFDSEIWAEYNNPIEIKKLCNRWRQTNLAVAQFRSLYMVVLRPHETGFDHSFFGLCKRLMRVLPPPAVMGKLLDLYLASAALGGSLLYSSGCGISR